MNEFETKRLRLYRREVVAREKQAAALEKIAEFLEPRAELLVDYGKLNEILGEADGSGFYDSTGIEITNSEISSQIAFLIGTGEYMNSKADAIFKVAVEMIQDETPTERRRKKER